MRSVRQSINRQVVDGVSARIDGSLAVNEVVRRKDRYRLRRVKGGVRRGWSATWKADGYGVVGIAGDEQIPLSPGLFPSRWLG